MQNKEGVVKDGYSLHSRQVPTTGQAVGVGVGAQRTGDLKEEPLA